MSTMETRYGPVKLKVPKGFPVLLQRFAREVIREQPDDIVAFGATFFETLIAERKVTGEDPLESDPFDKPGFHAPPKVLRPISSKIRQNEIERERAATKIQASYRGYQVRQASIKNGKRLEEQKIQQEAAIKIQSHYRGFQTRKSISHPVKTVEPSGKEIDDPFEQVGEGDESATQDEHTLDAETSENVSSQTANLDETGKLNESRKELIAEDKVGEMDESAKQDGLTSDEKTSEKLSSTVVTINEASEVNEDENEAAAEKKVDEVNKLTEEDQRTLDAETSKRLSPSAETLEEPNIVIEDVKETAREEKNEDDSAETDDLKEQEAAAVKIQAVFRGHKSRKQLQGKETQNDIPKTYNTDEEEAAVRIQAGFRGYKSRKHLQERKQQKETLVTYDKQQEEAAVKIQASFRGYQSRKNLSYNGDKNGDTKADYQEKEEAAAVKIQATFRGHKTRKQLNDRKKQTDVEEPSVDEESVLDPAPSNEKEIFAGKVDEEIPMTQEITDEVSQQEEDTPAVTLPHQQKSPDRDATGENGDTSAVGSLDQDETPGGDAATKDDMKENIEDKQTMESAQKDDLSAGDDSVDNVKETYPELTQDDGDTLSSANQESSSIDASPHLQDQVSADSPRDA